jgi:hypothetical protein
LNWPNGSIRYWSLGALYAVTNSTSIFGRVSNAGRFNVDRRTLGSNSMPMARSTPRGR